MKGVKIYYYDSFTDIPGKGNPAGVVLDADHLSEEEMQKLAKKVGLSETAFVLKSDLADLRLRYFTPGHEINLCGHGTMAAITGMIEHSELIDKKEMTVETLAGVLQVNYNDELKEVKMAHAPAKFKDFEGDVAQLAAAIGIKREDLNEHYPIVYGSTGTWTLIIPIKNIDTFLRMHPNNKEFPDLLKQIPTASIHPICFETYDKTCNMHGRHFSSPHSGTVEDPVTGTASGVMGAYYITYVKNVKQAELKVEQGYEIGRKGVVRVYVRKNNGKIDVSISGRAVYVDEIEIEI